MDGGKGEDKMGERVVSGREGGWEGKLLVPNLSLTITNFFSVKANKTQN